MENIELHRLEDVPPLRQRVHSQLEQLITQGVLTPGTRLVESDLASKLGVSRGSIREALQHLALDGFVDSRPRLGTFVHVPSADEVGDFFDMRRALESEASRLAAQRVTSEGAEKLRKLIQLGHDVIKAGGDPDREPDRISIHHAIHDEARSPILSQILSSFNKKHIWYMAPYSLARRNQTWHEHEIIVDAIVGGDSAAAHEATVQHIEGARTYYDRLAAEAQESST